MHHSYFKDKISAFYDNELNEEERHLIAEHLKECNECQRLLEQLKQFNLLVEKHTVLSDSDYWEKSAQKIEQAIDNKYQTEIVDIKKSHWKGIHWKLIGVAASIAIVTFISLYQKHIDQQILKTTPLNQKPVIKLEKGAPTDNRVWPPKLEPGSKIKKLPPQKEKPQLNLSIEESKNNRKPIINKKATGGKISSQESKPPSQKAIHYAPDRYIKTLQTKPTEAKEKELSLRDWRQKRDELLKSSIPSKIKIYEKSLTTNEKKKPTGIIQKPLDQEFRLLECYYHIGLLTNDSNEYKASINFLKKYTQKQNAKYKEQSQKYLRLLKEKNKKE